MKYSPLYTKSGLDTNSKDIFVQSQIGNKYKKMVPRSSPHINIEFLN